MLACAWWKSEACHHLKLQNIDLKDEVIARPGKLGRRKWCLFPHGFFVSWLFIRMFPQFLLFFFLGGVGGGGVEIWNCGCAGGRWTCWRTNSLYSWMMFLCSKRMDQVVIKYLFQSLLMAAVELNNLKRNQSIIGNVSRCSTRWFQRFFAHFHPLLGFDLIWDPTSRFFK